MAPGPRNNGAVLGWQNPEPARPVIKESQMPAFGDLMDVPDWQVFRIVRVKLPFARDGGLPPEMFRAFPSTRHAQGESYFA